LQNIAKRPRAQEIVFFSLKLTPVARIELEHFARLISTHFSSKNAALRDIAFFGPLRPVVETRVISMEQSPEATFPGMISELLRMNGNYLMTISVALPSELGWLTWV
jgi:hypothetical protein